MKGTIVLDLDGTLLDSSIRHTKVLDFCLTKESLNIDTTSLLTFKREGYKKRDINFGELLETLLYPGFLKIAKKYWREELYEFYRSFSKSAFIKSLRKLIPEINKEDFVPGGAGVRAQACDWRGNLIDDFLILEQKNVINVCNAPSPAATASLAIGEFVSKKIISKLGLNKIHG